MVKTIMVAALTIYCSTASAILPPLYSSLSEFKTLIEDPQLAGKLDSSQRIQSIVRTEKGFEVTTNKAVLPVEIIFEKPPQGWVGPAKFHLEFHEAVPTAG